MDVQGGELIAVARSSALLAAKLPWHGVPLWVDRSG